MIPSVVEQADYEAELGVVIGETVRNVSKENALEAVAGYVVANDVSARDLQFADGQWTRGKSVDTFCPVGPLVPRSEVPDPHALAIRAIVSGETLQDSNTSNLIFGIDEIISYASRTSTLEAGDLILTGTPAGVGVFRDPKRLLRAGRHRHDPDRRRRRDHQPGSRRLTPMATISRTVLREQVKDVLLQRIASGELKPGERLVETRIAQELGTSQAPVGRRSATSS